MAATLRLPEPFDLAALADVLTDRLERPVEFVPLAAGAFGPCGVLVSTDRAEYIGYPRDTTALHQRHIVLHEVGHLLCGHGGGTPLAAGEAGALLPHLSGELVRRVLGRNVYDALQEQEAELFASLVLHRAARAGTPAPRARPGAGADAAGTVSRLGPLFDVPGPGAGPAPTDG